MRKSFWDLRMPTLLAVITIAIGGVILSSFVQNTTVFQTKASLSNVPENIRITNIANSSFNISYITSKKVHGSIAFSENKNMEKVKLDDRDENTGSLNTYNTHYFTINNLKPKTKYYFSILSGEDTFLNNSLPFEITTTTSLTNSKDFNKTIKGKVQLSDASSQNEAIVYFTSDNAQILSTLLKEDGSYSISLDKTRTSDLSSYFNFSEDSKAQMLILGPVQNSKINFLIKNSENLPLVVLGNNYDFTIQASPINLENNTATDESSLKFPSFSSTVFTSNKEPQILQPKDNSGFIDNKPLFKGTALPGEKVEIVINSENQIKTQVTADQSGNWSYRPTTSLVTGDHKITIITRDALGMLKSITKSFTVYAAGTQVEESATPSATPIILIPTPTPTLTPTPTPIIIPSPTQTLIPTLVPTSIPTIFIPTTIPPELEPGNSSMINAVSNVFITFLKNTLSLIIH